MSVSVEVGDWPPPRKKSPWQFHWWLKGSPDAEGIVLSNVKWNGKDAVYKASLPIVRVEYDSGVLRHDNWPGIQAGPFKDALNYNTAFFMKEKSPYQKVYVHTEGEGDSETIILEASYEIGKYTLWQRWILDPDGKISARLSSKGIQHPGDHRHHVYWRFDFASPGGFEEYNSAPGISCPTGGEVILFEHANFRGAHKHVVRGEPHLDSSHDGFFNDRVSSLAILRGNWRLYSDTDYRGKRSLVLGPGLYPYLPTIGFPNDALSSLEPTDEPAELYGEPMAGHVILFRDKSLSGAHRHVFRDEPNLNASEDGSFNDLTSSIAVVSGTWAFAKDSEHRGELAARLGRGLYPWVGDVGLPNDSISSLRPVKDPPNVEGAPLRGHVILFEHENFRGGHHHGFDRTMNVEPITSSIVVDWGYWRFFSGPGCARDYPDAELLGEGGYPWVQAVGIKNDDAGSFEPVDPGPFQAGWGRKPTEFCTVKSPGTRRGWRIRPFTEACGYYLVPGPDDGMADSFCQHDLWVLHYHPEEDRGGRQGDEHHDGLDVYVSGEAIAEWNPTVWYCAHLTHLFAEGPDEWHEAGLDLVPFDPQVRSRISPGAMGGMLSHLRAPDLRGMPPIQ